MAMTMMGTPALVGLNSVRSQPASPIVVLTTNMSTITMANVPSSERRRMAAAATMTTNTIGMSLRRSSWVASAKARCMTTSPVR